ncbi:GNAT family N-acetyltransferase [Nonomuraea aridisoli]|uniref:GNAT family N-acetyltransferase n=1 Tax=Nonomuraea aridisoli TaxID=2070368 RepID=A0A2W2EHG0_9ACTN|nr:GNAT family N-acetyltransferase [Nonomuraea aridisoli]PZG08807.1 GNAT family N-acetyltransferase [Nonomuraea aridisoli]
MIEVRELREMAEFQRVNALFDDIWHFSPAEPPVTVELMRVLSHIGGYVAGAFDGGRLVGASVGLLAAGGALHSHVTGVTAGGAGLELKLHQRRWALERGIDRVTWTYDPLVRRNAHFNLAKLGARPQEYLPCFYGVMEDAINRDDESDRLLTVWPLTAPHVEALARREPYATPVPPDAAVALADEGGRPVRGPVDAETVLVAVPADVESLRRADPGLAKAWRLAVREVLGGLMAEGREVTGFAGRSRYVVRKA